MDRNQVPDWVIDFADPDPDQKPCWTKPQNSYKISNRIFILVPSTMVIVPVVVYLQSKFEKVRFPLSPEVSNPCPTGQTEGLEAGFRSKPLNI
jgi:hypothetical protein